MTGEPIQIGARRFRELRRSTIAQDAWVMGRLRQGGVLEFAAEADEDAAAFGWRALAKLLEAGVLYEVLGGLIVPAELEDLAWRPEVALETATFLGELWEAADKEQVHRLAATLLFPFLRDVLFSFATSLRCSAALAAAAARNAASSTGANGER